VYTGAKTVKCHILALLDTGKTEWREALEKARRSIPELRPLLLLNIVQETK